MFVSCVFRRLPLGVQTNRGRLGLSAVILAFAALGFGGCAQRPQDVAVGHGKEYFPASVYGRASPRVIADGQPVPHGGGQYLVGKPYTIAGRTYYPSESHRTQVGNASWYGDAFHGRLTANGEIYDRNSFTAASPIMPLPCYARVTNLRNNYSMVVRVNDRGPYASDRIMDVSRRVAEALDFKRHGTTRLKVEYVGRASLAGSDDQRLMATLRTNGPAPAETNDPILVAESALRPVRVASIAPDPVPAASEQEVDRQRPRSRYVDEDRPRHRAAPREGTEDRRDRRAFVASRATRDPDTVERFSDRESHKGIVTRPPRGDVADLRRRREIRNRDDIPETRVVRTASRDVPHHVVLPPSRPIELATIPGAPSQIRAHRTYTRIRVARDRDE